MSITTTGAHPGSAPGRPVRRVRHEVRDGLAVVAFSAASSLTLAGVMLVLLRWAA